ncbi:uncharacterized protein LOC143180867 isoform X2 [Calliopsis andreniformis]|uniref:uncharacterized protein LOC143180867 isoform X2 n=1 Tax=Calliopsis andreniformis TaxID=337506 RepID=UPI003FCECCFC
MPYYGGEGLPYYYGSPFANHSSLMTGTPSFHAPLSRFSPHLSTISESPLSNLRRYSPVSVPSRPRRVIDTADIDVSTPRILSSDGNRQRNRLRRDRPTIKIRSQALKDNPALREHNEKHEKSVGELLVEKFLIKDKKDEAERRLQLFHQISLDRDDTAEDPNLQQVKNKITRRFTRRRSSADIQLDPEQLERELAYAQVQATVLDTLVAEEQAEIENEVRRGTLIKKGATGGLKTIPGFFRPMEEGSVAQSEDDSATQKIRKTLKKVKKKKKTTDKPSPPADEEGVRERRSSTSSDVSMDTEESEDRKHTRPQMYKIEASNSAGDFSTVWLNSGDNNRNMSIEQFRESIKIPIPRKLGLYKVDRDSVEEESETEVILPVKRPYVKDTSRNSVYFTVRTPTENVNTDPLKRLETITNGVNLEKKEKAPEKLANLEKKEKAPEKIVNLEKKEKAPEKLVNLEKKEKEPEKIVNLEKKEKAPEKLVNLETKEKAPEKLVNLETKEKAPEKLVNLEKKDKAPEKLENLEKKEKTSEKLDTQKQKPEELDKEKPKEAVKTPKASTPKLKAEETNKVVPDVAKPQPVSTAKKEEVQRRPEPSRPRKAVEESSAKRVEASNATLAVDLLASESSASVALSSSTEGLPKVSKINTDENNAVEAPKLSLRDAEYLAKPKKIERDEDVGRPLPGNKANKAVTLKNASSSSVAGGPSGVEAEDSPRSGNRSGKSDAGDATTLSNVVTKTTLSGSPNIEAQKKATQKIVPEAAEANKVKDASAQRFPKKGDEEDTKSPFKVVAKKTESKVEEKSALKGNSLSTSKTEESKIPWRTKVTKKPSETSVPLDRSISADSSITKEVSKPLKQSISVEESLVSKMPVEILAKPFEGLNGDGGALSKSASTESIDFWSEIKGPESPKVAKMTKVAKGLSFVDPKSAEPRSAVTELRGKELEEKKETDAKISIPAAAVGLSNIPVIEEERTAEEESLKSDERTPQKSGIETEAAPKKILKNKKDLSITIGPASKDAYSTVKQTPLMREDSTASTISAKSVTSTPETSVPASEVSTPVFEAPVPIINIVEAATPTKTDSQVLEDEEELKTPTNELSEPGLVRISKWSNHTDLSNVDETEKDITPVASKEASANASPEASPESSKKKKVIRKKKASTTKKASSKEGSKESKKKSLKKSSSKSQDSLKPPEPKIQAAPKAAPTPKPIDLIRMFYTTPSALLTATPRDLSKVRRAKIKRKKHHSRTPSVSSDSTGSTTSTATTESSGSTCTELDDDPDKRMNSTRSNDSGFDGSPRISTPSQSSDTQRNSDSSDHFPSGRITPPATNLPRFKKYAVSDFNFLKVLGKGSFGKVLLAELRGTECVYAVKCLKKDVVLEDDDVECTLIERKVLTLATRHPYLCHLFCTFQTDSHLFFVMEYLNGGDLMFHIQKSGRFSETRARFYAAEIWSGLNFLHKKGIVYRDLKLDNVLLDFEGHIRIADFGMCKLQIFLDRTADTFCGTPDYMAPEIIKGLKYNQAVDWWSYGVLLYEMLTGQSPFSGCDEDELFWSICNERPFIPRYLSQESTDILVSLLEKDAGKRLPGHEIAMHGFFQSLPWDRLERRQLEPPFRPALDHTLDTRYFDTAFTAERPRLTPVPEQILTSMDQGVFRGFSYTNPNATD